MESIKQKPVRNFYWTCFAPLPLIKRA